MFFGEQGAVQRLDLLFFFKIAKAYRYVCVSLRDKMSPGDKRGDKRDRGDIRRQTGDKRRQRGDKKRQRRQKKRHFGNKGVELEEPRKSKIAKNILLCPVTCQEPGMRLFAECP